MRLKKPTPKQVYRIMSWVIGGCAIDSFLKYFVIWRDVPTPDIIQRGFAVFALALFALISLSFYKRFISLLNESWLGILVSIIISALFGLLLWFSANFSIWFP